MEEAATEQPTLVPTVAVDSAAEQAEEAQDMSEAAIDNTKDEAAIDDAIDATDTIQDEPCSSEEQQKETKDDAEQPSIQEIDEEDDFIEKQQETWTFLRKGAVAAVGGTMVGVGLVMIPLPTPFGAAIASSGLAVLGTEFAGAAKMNDKLIGAATESMESARDHVIKRIEKMEEEELQQTRDDEEQDTQPKSRQRATKEYMAKFAGNFLSRTVLPILKRNGQQGASSATSVDSSWEPLDEHTTTTEGNTTTEGALAEGDSDEEELDGTFVIVQEEVLVD